jgi:hypothetical protein
MEIASSSAPQPPISTQKPRQPLRRDLSNRRPNTPKQAGSSLRDGKFAPRSPPRAMGYEADRSALSKIQPSYAHASKPLVPVSERWSGGDDAKNPKGKKDIDATKWDIAPDGGSAGREGRQFTVANVGNNGKIFLR